MKIKKTMNELAIALASEVLEGANKVSVSVNMGKEGNYLYLMLKQWEQGNGHLEQLEAVLEESEDADLPYMVKEKIFKHFEQSGLGCYQYGELHFDTPVSVNRLLGRKRFSFKHIDAYCRINRITPHFLLFSELEKFEAVMMKKGRNK